MIAFLEGFRLGSWLIFGNPMLPQVSSTSLAVRADQGQARPWVFLLTTVSTSGLIPHWHSADLTKGKH